MTISNIYCETKISIFQSKKFLIWVLFVIVIFFVNFVSIVILRSCVEIKKNKFVIMILIFMKVLHQISDWWLFLILVEKRVNILWMKLQLCGKLVYQSGSMLPNNEFSIQQFFCWRKNRLKNICEMLSVIILWILRSEIMSKIKGIKMTFRF